jgi:DNA-binding response OmpR family regulator
MWTMARQTVLVVEDDRAIRAGIADALDFGGYAVAQAATGSDGMQMALHDDYDLLLLDLILPGCDGLQILEQLRMSRPTLPVIILSARGGENDRIRGLRLGADDYAVKPFSVRELLARIEAVLRRSPERPSDLSTVQLLAGLADLRSGEVHFDDGRSNHLSERETDLLRYLACNAGRVLSRDELLSRIWRLKPSSVSTRTVDMHIARLREKLRAHDSHPDLIVTVRGKGYRFSINEDLL